jgi:ubiquinone/menaquinone biosynthesis C-methylase UbiE
MTNDSIVFDRAADFYDQTRGFPPGEEQRIAALFARVGNLTATSRVLEIGIGTGRIALPLARHVDAYFGIDLARPMMARLQAKQTDEPIHLAQADATQLPFISGIFDAVIVVHVFHLIPNWQGVLAEVARVLRPGAPLLHGWGAGDPIFRALQLLDKQIPNEVGVPREHYTTFLETSGWQSVSDLQTHNYTYSRVPQQTIEQLRQRIWSRTWRMTDDELTVHIANVQAAINDQYNDPNAPVEVEGSFTVRAYWPPR